MVVNLTTGVYDVGLSVNYSWRIFRETQNSVCTFI